MEQQEQSASQDRLKSYEPIHGCSHPIPCWQIVGLIIMFAIEGLNFYLISQIDSIRYIAVYVLFSLNQVTLVLMVIGFFILTFSDPSDPRLKDSSYSEPGQKVVNCYRCHAKVSVQSHHCNSCKRCVQKFDHHCVFLNNCIGKQNYGAFAKFLIVMIAHTAFGMTIGILYFLKLEDGVRWAGLAFAILNFSVLMEVGILAIFHFYLSFCIYKTTLEFLRGDRDERVHNEPPIPISNPTPDTSPVAIRPNPRLQDHIVQSPSKPKEQQSTGTGFRMGNL